MAVDIEPDDGKLTYQAIMTDTATGQTKAVNMGRVYGLFHDGVGGWCNLAYHWTDGNLKCDCHRHNVFYDDGLDFYYPCNNNHNRFKCHRLVLSNGVVSEIDGSQG